MAHEGISVLVVDDHDMVRHGIISVLQIYDDIDVVGEAKSGFHSITLYQDLVPDIVLMDLIMPGMTGAVAAREIKKINPEAKIIALTAYDKDTSLINQAINSGVCGYLLKSISHQDLADAIRRCAKGDFSASQEITSAILDPIINRREARLSEREIDVLRLIVRGRRNYEIADILVISEHTVRFHVSNVIRKLGAGNRTEAAMIANQKGIL